MKNFKIIMTLIGILSLNAVNGQEGLNYKPEKFKPSYGDVGIYLGLSGAELEEFTDEDVDIRAYPIINVKYFISDEIEARVGFQRYKKTTVLEGSLSENFVGNEINTSKNGFWRLAPGAAYHFTKSTWVDVYGGLSIPFGVERTKLQTKWVNDATGDFQDNLKTKSTTIIGYSAFIGIQAFVADLPLAIGFEYGLTGMHHFGLQYEVEYSENIGGISNSNTFYTTDENSFTSYDDLKYRKFVAGNDIRLTISYYFSL